MLRATRARVIAELVYRRAPGRLVSGWRDIGGLSLHERRAGAVDGRPPVVLVHGLGVSGRYFAPLAVRLAVHRRVLAPDLPGFGRSESPSRPLTLPQLADALAAWLDAAGIGAAPLVANSFGCQVVMELALRRPERVDRAVLVGPSVDPHARSVLRQVARLAVDAVREPPALIPLAAYDYLAAGPRTVVATVREALRDRPEDKAGGLSMPVLVVRGERDAIVSQRWVEELTRRLPDGRLVVLPGVPHAANYSAPGPLAAAILPFLGARSP